MHKDLLSADEAANYLGVTPVTVYRWCREGRIPCAKAGKLWRVRRDALEEFLRRNEERSSLLGPQIRAFLEVLSENVAIVDRDGTIIAVNDAWKMFALENDGPITQVAEGINYLGVCDAARGDQAEYARAFASGLRSVLSGARTSFAMEYPCHSPSEQRWFVGRARSFQADGKPLAAVLHENVTERKLLERRLDNQTY